ncbi:hypothetical protein KJP29_05565 [Maritimibacter sp. DP1N21-5]|nr:hypothetical protein [Maritimibacter sp. DP1N21-5]
METTATCHCGKTAIALIGVPIMSNACCCTSCQTANHRFETMPGAGKVVHDSGATPYTLMRKDRVRLLRGREYLEPYRLTPNTKTRRVLATCCNAPMYLDFKGGHWISVYTDRIPEADRLPVEVYTMAGDLADPSGLAVGIPAPRTHTLKFMVQLMSAWVAMGFRVPKLGWVKD